MSLAVQYRITLTPEEFRLVSKALRAPLVTDADKAAALALQKRMLELRASDAETLLGQFDKAAEAAERGER